MNDLSLHILDILQNSLSAGASEIALTVDENPAADRLTITVADNGRGMSAAQVARLEDPFFTSRTTRRVGMGIPLLMQTARQSGGDVKIDSEPGRGTTVTATFDLANIDRPPLGDVSGAVMLTVAANPAIEFVFTYRYKGMEWALDTREVREAIGPEIPLSEPAVAKMLAEMMQNNIEMLKS